MKKVYLSLEELEYLLIMNNCEYIYGFPDAFIKIDRSKIERKFDDIAESLENHNYIKRNFKSETNYSDDILKLISIIKEVDVYYDINIIKSNIVDKKYRIYKHKNQFLFIEINSYSNNRLDFSQMCLSICDEKQILDEFPIVLNLLFKNINKKIDSNIFLTTDMYDKINKLNEEDFVKLLNYTNDNKLLLLKKIYKIITYEEIALSISKTDMKERKSKVIIYCYSMKDLIRMEFVKENKEYVWNINSIDESCFKEEAKKLFE